jgi:hypothetical protein
MHGDGQGLLQGAHHSGDHTRRLAGAAIPQEGLGHRQADRAGAPAPLAERRQRTSRLGQQTVADPDLICRHDVGQGAYIYRDGVTYIQVKRLVAGPATLPGPPARPPGPRCPSPADGSDAVRPESPLGSPPAGMPHGQPPGRLADIAALLDEAFSPSPGGLAPDRFGDSSGTDRWRGPRDVRRRDRGPHGAADRIRAQGSAG